MAGPEGGDLVNGIAGLIGWLVIWTVVATVIAVALGKALKFLGRPQPEPEDWDPAPRNMVAPHVVPPWRPAGSDLDDPNARSTSPHDPAS